MSLENLDLATIEFTELVALKEKVAAEIGRRENEEKSKAKKQIIELAKAYGLSVEEVLGKIGAASARKPVEAKYRSPENAELTWTGRGRKPQWVQAHLDNGGELTDLEIK